MREHQQEPGCCSAPRASWEEGWGATSCRAWLLVVRLLSEVGISTSSVFEERRNAWLVRGGTGRNQVTSSRGLFTWVFKAHII